MNWREPKELESQAKVPIGSMKTLASEFRKQVSAENNAARGVANAARSFGIKLDRFREEVGPPVARARDDLCKKPLCLLLGDEDTQQWL